MSPRVLFFSILLTCPLCLFADIVYEVKFLGLEDKTTLNAIKNHADLIKLKNRPPASVNGLRYRIHSDIPKMIKVLHSQGYYDASISSSIENEEGEAIVYLFIHSGPRYLLESYEFYTADCKEKKEIACSEITLEMLNVELKKPALSKNIIEAEEILLNELANCGYPLSAVENREVTVDVVKKTVQVRLCIETGPLCRFGPITMIGIKDVKDEFLARKILWKEGDIYSENLVNETQKKLIDTDLFSSVLISHADALDASGELPMKIRFSESKHKSLSLGLSFATVDGFGLSLGWSHRNFRQMGERLNLDLNIARVYSTGVASYMKPDFLRMDQNLLVQLKSDREHITVYIANTYSAQSLIERYFNTRHYGSLGVKWEFDDIHKSIRNGKFSLFSLPLYYKYTNVSSLLDPTSGLIVQYKASPYQAVTHHKDFFFKEEFEGSFFVPITTKREVVLAFRVQLGSIVGAPFLRIPMNKLFFGGSEDNLRGYRFKTVSPLNNSGDPVGGTGALYFTSEIRFRITEKIGFVSFFDTGTVTRKRYPTLASKWYKSAGIGLRYFTFFGPLRLDVGFPMNRRPFDPSYRIYASVGQTF